MEQVYGFFAVGITWGITNAYMESGTKEQPVKDPKDQIVKKDSGLIQ